MSAAATTAVVLAADRGPNDAVAAATGAPCKALAPVAGQPLLWRVLDALNASTRIDDIIVVGPERAVLDADPAAARALAARGARWLAPASSPSASAARALAALPAARPVLLTSADHGLLRAATVDTFLAGLGDADLAVGLVPLDAVRAAHPQVRRTAIRLRPRPGYCSTNLFALRGPAARTLVARWQTLEHRRKQPARYLAAVLGWPGLVRYALGSLTLDAALARAGRRTGARIGAVLLTEVDAAIDVDSVDDLALVESILAARGAAHERHRLG